MNRRNFLTLTGTFTGGTLLLPSFLHAFGSEPNLVIGEQCLVFIQLNGGNDGLNTFIPYDNPLYYDHRTNIAISKDTLISKNNGMAFHPALKDFATIQQNGDLAIIQNVGYPQPNRSHFRSQEIWQTASPSDEYLNDGWLGRYLDLQCKAHQPTASINIDTIDTLALKGNEPNTITIKDPNRFKVRNDNEESIKLSDNPQLDFVRKIANSVTEGSEDIQKALAKSTSEINYPKTNLGKNLEWIARLIKGNLNSKVYYTTGLNSNSFGYIGETFIEGYGEVNRFMGVFEITDYYCTSTIIDGNDTLGTIIPYGITTGVLNQEQSSYSSLGPNPTKDIITINFPIDATGNNSTLEVKDIFGKSISSQVIPVGSTSEKINLQNLASGIYFIEVKMPHFSKQYKVVKE